MERSIAENAKPTVGSIQKPKIEVTVDPAELDWIASIQIEYQLRGGPSHKVAQAFPIPRLPFTAPKKDTHQIWVDGKQVPSETVLLDTSSPSGLGVGYGLGSNGQGEHWKPMMADWIASDPALQQMVDQHAKLIQRAAGYNEAFREFEDRVKEHLIHKDLWTAALYVAQGDTYPSHLVSLMPEVDPALRIDGNYQRWQYVSVLESSSRPYQPYYDQWRKQASDWIESKANLAELLPALRTGYASHTAARELLQKSILKHLHDKRGLSLQTSLDFASYIDSRSRQQDNVPEFLARAMFPAVRKSLDDAAEQQKRELKSWGYDLSQVSRITGNLCDQRFDLSSILSHDPTIAQALGRMIPEDAGRHNRTAVVPAHATFQVPLADGETADIRIQYDVAFGSLPHPMDSRFRTHGSELIVPFPPLDQKVGDVPVTIMVQKPAYAIVSPPQDSIKIHANKSRTIQTLLTAEMPTLHLCVFNDLEAHVHRVRMGVGPSLQGIQQLQSKIQNPSALALLKAVVCRDRSNTDFWAAAKMAGQVTKDHPELGEPWELMQPHDAKRFKELQQWIDTKAVAPVFSEEDWKRQELDNHHLSASVAKELAERVKGLDVSKLNLAQQAGRLFILCEVGIDYDRNLAELVGIGDQDTDSVLTVLTLIEHLSKPKTDAISFVLEQQRKGSQQDHRIAAGHALRTFRSADSVRHLVNIAGTATDAILIQVIFGVLRDCATPEIFGSLVGLDQIAESASESAFVSYLDSMLRSNRKLAIPRLKELFTKYPKHQSIILDRWGDAVESTQAADSKSADQKTEVLRLAIRRYTTSDDPGSAAGVIRNLATPAELGELSYRKSLKRWVNETIIGAIASRGDKSAYGFVESFYHEFVKGVPSRNDHSCARAFQQVGDSRAIPFLREIFGSTERKNDAARAIGHLSLNRTLPAQRHQKHPLDQWLQVAVNRIRSTEERRSAVTKLLTDRAAAAQRLVHHSPLRYELAEPEVKWRHGYVEKYGVLAPLGDVVVQELLEASDDCSLQQRYFIANLLQVFLPASNDRLRSVAASETVNSDRQLTAELAIQLSTSAK